MSLVRRWFIASRPKTLLVSLTPIIIGTKLSAPYGPIEWNTLAFIFIGAVAIQVGTNFVNDYVDFKRGTDTDDRKGPQRALQTGDIHMTHMKRAAILAFIIAGLASLYLIYIGGLPILIIAISSIVSGILYTAGPFSLAYLGIADVFAFAFFGPVAVWGTTYLLTGSSLVESLILGCIPGCFSMAILSVNNLRDIEEDRQAEKKTLAVRFGKRFVQFEYLFCHIAVYGILIYQALTTQMLSLSFWLFPFSLLLIKEAFTLNDSALNQTLAKTSFLLFLMGLLL